MLVGVRLWLPCGVCRCPSVARVQCLSVSVCGSRAVRVGVRLWRGGGVEGGGRGGCEGGGEGGEGGRGEAPLTPARHRL